MGRESKSPWDEIQLVDKTIIESEFKDLPYYDYYNGRSIVASGVIQTRVYARRWSQWFPWTHWYERVITVHFSEPIGPDAKKDNGGVKSVTRVISPNYGAEDFLLVYEPE